MARVEKRALSRRIRTTGAVQPVEAYSIPVPRLADSDSNLVLTRIAPSGAQVQPGDLVAEFDRTRQLDRARDAKAKFDDFEHQYEQKKAQQRSEAEKRASELQQAQADLAKARLELRKGPLLSEIDRLKYESQLGNAQAHAASLEKSGRLRDQAAVADLKILELQRDRQKVALERAQANADKLQLRAPIAGMVAQEVIWKRDGPGRPQEGDQLYTGQPLLRIFSSGRMEVLLTIGEPDGAALAPGSQALVRLDAYPDRVFRAHFDSASPVASALLDSPVRTFTARFRIDDQDARLLPDLSAALDLEIAMGAPALVVPRTAVRYRDHQTFVIRVGESGAHEERPVELGASGDAYIEVRSGLREGDRVLVEGSGAPAVARIPVDFRGALRAAARRGENSLED